MKHRFNLSKTLKNLLFFILIAVVFSCQNKKVDQESNMKLWYLSPADASVKDNPDGWKDDEEWLKALPLGNGSLGAMVFGDVNYERIQLNEESMWSGSQYDNDNPAAFPAQAKIRELLFAGKYKEATELTQKTQICRGKGSGHGNGADVPFGCFQTLGDLWLNFGNKGEYSNYYRELDLNNAVARVAYTQSGIKYRREIFVSHPDQVMVIRLTADQPSSVSFEGTMTRPERFTTKTQSNELVMHGSLNNGQGGDGLQYMARLAADHKNGTLDFKNGKIIVKNADEVTLYLTASTDYVLDSPDRKGRDFERITQQHLDKAKKTSYSLLFDRHKEEYQQYFKRVDFNLTGNLKDTVPTDVRIQRSKNDQVDQHLIELIFQFGRYLLISSSRPGTLPANLQGIWANKIQTPWNGDYHTDVNVQMNYWMAENTNLSEMHEPLFDLMNSLTKPGSKTAKIHYNADGWVVHPITNVWGFTAPGESAGWGMHVGGGAWLTTHIMEHYYYTLDKDFLKKNFDVLKGATRFYLDWLIADPETGELLSGPSVSPENRFVAPDGSISKICMGPAHDQQVIWQLFKNYMDASAALGIQDEMLNQVIETQKLLAKPKIGSDGRLMEWNEEFKELEKGHRHISHLFALHPGYQIDLKKTPVLAKAAKKSLDVRIEYGGGHTGWSAAWLVNQYARLGEAENAEKSLQTVLTKSTTPNLFGQHPPFQMDANFGTSSGIAEMLVQSQSGEIRLLPAIPPSWKDGKIKGLPARGGFIIDIKWNDGVLADVRVFSKKGGECTLEYKGKTVKLDTEQNKAYTVVNNEQTFGQSS